MTSPTSAVENLSEEDLLALYLSSARDEIRQLQALLTQVRETPERWGEIVLRMREIVHVVKGQGTSFGYPLMTRVGDSLSRLLKALDAPNDDDIDLVGTHINTFEAVLQNNITGSGGELGETLASRLEALVDKRA